MSLVLREFFVNIESKLEYTECEYFAVSLIASEYGVTLYPLFRITKKYELISLILIF